MPGARPPRRRPPIPRLGAGCRTRCSSRSPGGTCRSRPLRPAVTSGSSTPRPRRHQLHEHHETPPLRHSLSAPTGSLRFDLQERTRGVRSCRSRSRVSSWLTQGPGIVRVSSPGFDTTRVMPCVRCDHRRDRCEQSRGDHPRPGADNRGLTQRGIRCRIEAGRWLRACNGVYVCGDLPDVRATGGDRLCQRLGCNRLALHRRSAPWPSVPARRLSGPRARAPGHVDSVDCPAAVHTADDLARTCDHPDQEPAGHDHRTDDRRRRRLVHRPRLARLVDDALDRKLVTLRSLEDSLRLHERSGRSGTVALRSVVSERGGGLEITESELERRYLGFCESTGVPAPDLQQKIHWRATSSPRRHGLSTFPGDRRARRPERHQQLTDQERDRIRDQEAAAAGWLTVRVTWLQLREGRERAPRTDRDDPRWADFTCRIDA